MPQNNQVPQHAEGKKCGSAWRSLRRVVLAELLKQHRTLFGSSHMYFSMLIWPVLELATIYYTFRPVLDAPDVAVHWAVAGDVRTVLLFFITGMLGFLLFRSSVQASWQFSFERFNGTLETLFLTPVNRLVLIVANGAGALIQNVWLFLTFSIGLMVIVGGLHMSSPAMLLVAFLGLLVPALCWATFLNSVCIFSRDSTFVFTLMESTMPFFSGTRIPLQAFPLWARIVSTFFPLTTSLIVLRGAMLSNETLLELWPSLLFLTGFSVIMLLMAAIILKKGEAHARLYGTLTLF